MFHSAYNTNHIIFFVLKNINSPTFADPIFRITLKPTPTHHTEILNSPSSTQQQKKNQERNV